MRHFGNFTLLVVFCGLRGEALCSYTKIISHYPLLLYAYETNSNSGIEEECEKGMHWFRLLDTTAFIQKEYFWLHRLLPCSWALPEHKY